MQSELRKDYIQDRYVLIAPGRAKRPHEIVEKDEPQHAPKDRCHFCPDRVNYSEERGRRGGVGHDWKALSLINAFPVVTLDNPKAYGAQEVIVDTPDHEQTFEEMPLEHTVQLLELYQDRVSALSALPNIQYVLTFKNHGGRAGASIHHSHSQVFATGFLPSQLFDKSRKTHEYMIQHGRCAYCDILQKEKSDTRWIWSDKHIACFAPYASMHNYEVWVMPWRHMDNITDLHSDELTSLAHALQSVVRQIVGLGLPYNFYCHQVIFDAAQHMYIKIIPRGSMWAGVEIGSGLIINTIPPEEAAAYYRAHWKA
jgi:UDPglucose--hexose-1-phosphate uridylyltransferase